MLIRASSLKEENGRRPYPVEGCGFPLIHFVTRTTLPENPFEPHKHPNREIWYVLSGEGFYFENGTEEKVEAGDMMRIDAWDEHGLRTQTCIEWLCLG